MKLSEYIKRFGDKQVDVEKLSEFIIEDKVWLPKENEGYWYVSDLGKTRSFNHNNDYVDEAITSLQQVYRTEAEAKFARDKQKFLLFMEREFIRNSDVIDWEKVNQYRYAIHYDHSMSEIIIGGYIFIQMQMLYTTNKEWLEQFIEEHEEDIKKYYFEVKENENE